MKKLIIFSIFILITLSINAFAQETNTPETYGRTLNLGGGIGSYTGKYGNIVHTLPVFHINYEFDVLNNFTIAPFASFYTCNGKYNSGSVEHPNKYNTYCETVIPVGLKGTYYFDDMLNAGKDWDFYLAGSLGMVIVSSKLDEGSTGTSSYNNSPCALSFDLHIGTEFHINKRFGVFVDVSTGISTVGLAIH